MAKYLKSYTLNERWETFKQQDVFEVYPLIDAIEDLSMNPTKINIDIVRQLEDKYDVAIRQLNAEDREVLEDMIVRIMYQAYRQVDDSYTRWNFAMDRATDKGVGKEFSKLGETIEKAEEAMRQYASSGIKPEDYVELQKKNLRNLSKTWDTIMPKLKQRLTPYYVDFLSNQFRTKRDVIRRHIDYFDNNTFGEWLSSIRDSKGWSLVRAAEETGVSSSYIHRIEKGTRSVPSVPKLEQLAKGYGIPHSTMITMAGGDVVPVDTYLESGAYLVNGEVASSNMRHEFAELMRVVLEATDSEEVLEQVNNIRGLLGRDNEYANNYLNR